MNNVKVKNIQRNGRAVPNQFIITTPEGEYFQSYDSVIAYRDKSGAVFLDEATWDYSVTTGRYRNEFLGEGIAETRKKIASGEYVLTDLNK